MSLYRPSRLRRRRAPIGFRLLVGVLGLSMLSFVFRVLGGTWIPFTSPGKPEPSPTPVATVTPEPSPLPINRDFAGITTFRGNASRSYYGVGPVPRKAEIKWRFPAEGSMCGETVIKTTTGNVNRQLCGVGWTGQANVVQVDGRVEVRFGGFDGAVHFLDGKTGQTIRQQVETGGLPKGSMTTDPGGFPLVYVGSMDGKLRVIALDRDTPQVLWELDSQTSVDQPLWGKSWNGSPLILGDYMVEGGENSWIYVVKLNRDYDRDGLVTVNPEIVWKHEGWDDQLLSDLGDQEVSIENSVAYRRGVIYFANSGGLVQGWDISRILDGGTRAEQVFRFWTGDDTDATITIDPDGYLYVGVEVQRRTARSSQVGQLIKLDPSKPETPVVWSVTLDTPGLDGQGGIWGTPAIADGMVYVPTNAGELVGVDAKTGKVWWSIQLTPPAWSSPVVVDGVLLQGDCSGTLYAYDVARRPHAEPPLLWKVEIAQGCLEATPIVWHGWIYVGDRAGGFYGIAESAAP